MNRYYSTVLATHLLVGLGAFVLSSPAAQAWDVTYYFTAHGENSEFTGDGSNSTQGPTETISASVTYKILTVAPPDNVITDGSTEANSVASNWVQAEFSGLTSNGSIAPAPVVGTSPWDTPSYEASVHNRYTNATNEDYSNQYAGKSYYWSAGTQWATSGAGVNRFMYGGPPWFSGLNFDTQVSPQYNYFYTMNYSVDFSAEPYTYTGTTGFFIIDSWVLGALDLMPLAQSLIGVGSGKSLYNKIISAQAYFDAADVPSACLMLADFASEVGAQRNKKLTVPMADKLTNDAVAIMTVIGCD